MNQEELFPIVDTDGNVTGTATRRECHSGSMLLHPVVHLHIIGSNKSVYLQKRSINKDIQPGKWDTAVGGHVDVGELIVDALAREASEELGIEISKPVHIKNYVFTSDRERELVHAFYMMVDPAGFNPTLDPEEIEEGRFWTFEELNEVSNQELLTPNFLSEYTSILCPLLSSL